MRCGSACMSFDRPHSNRVVRPYHVAISSAFDYRGWQVKHSLPIHTKRVGDEHPRAIHPNETVGAVPVCPPERPRSGVSIPKTHALCAGILTMDAPLQGDSGGHTGAAPTNLHQTTRYAPTASHCTFDSSKSHGVPLPHRGYTFDSTGLASTTQPTLGNDVRDEATPLGVVLFLITHHYHTRRMDYS